MRFHTWFDMSFRSVVQSPHVDGRMGEVLNDANKATYGYRLSSMAD